MNTEVFHNIYLKYTSVFDRPTLRSTISPSLYKFKRLIFKSR